MTPEKSEMEYDSERREKIALAAEFRSATTAGYLAEEAASTYTLARHARGEGRDEESAALFMEAGSKANLAVMAHLIDTGAIELPTA